MTIVAGVRGMADALAQAVVLAQRLPRRPKLLTLAYPRGQREVIDRQKHFFVFLAERG